MVLIRCTFFLATYLWFGSLLFFPLISHGQQRANATISQGEASVKEVRVVEFEGVELKSVERQVGKRPVLVVSTDAPRPLIRGYEKTNPFPPRPLLAIGDGRYVLEGAPGSEWTIEVLSIVDGVIWSKFLQGKIGDLPGGEEPPDDPVDPPQNRWEKVTKLVAESTQVKEDSETARRLRDAYRSVLESTEAKTIAELNQEVGDARARALEVDDVNVDWFALFTEAGKLLNEDPPKNVAEYKLALTAFMEGLK